ncbi:MAG: YdcF family protein [Chloroflexi bacterium]|nr:YdcF family protein [Chloroflexota bacterium]
MDRKLDSLVQVIWDYMLVGQRLRCADCIFMLGSYDIRVADYAIDLFQKSYAPHLLFSGGVVQRNEALGVFWDLPEADYFARHALALGVPAERILVENRASNTGENFLCARDLLRRKGLDFTSFILVQKPFMERRVLATAQMLWRDFDFVVTSPPISCADYLNGDLPREALIQYIVGDFQRVKVYGDKGFQMPQPIPDRVWDAFEQLCALGYDERLV